MAKEFSRTQRLSETMQRELAQIFHQEIKDPRLTVMVTISDVTVTPDLSYAKVYVSLFSTQEIDIKATIKLLNSMSGFVRSLLAKRIKARTTPQLKFIYDETLLKGNQLAKMIDDAVEEDEARLDKSSQEDNSPNE